MWLFGTLPSIHAVLSPSNHIQVIQEGISPPVTVRRSFEISVALESQKRKCFLDDSLVNDATIITLDCDAMCHFEKNISLGEEER